MRDWASIISFTLRSPQSREDNKPSGLQLAADFGRQEKEECERRYRCAFSLIGAANFLVSYFFPPSTAWRKIDNFLLHEPIALMDPVKWLFNIYSTSRHCYLFAKKGPESPFFTTWPRFAKIPSLNPSAHHPLLCLIVPIFFFFSRKIV